MSSLCVCLIRRTLFTALVVLTFGALSLAQSTTDGAIGGTIYDSNGAAIPNAQVVVHNNGTNAEQTTTTDSSGYYRVIKLQPGSYTVAVSEKGFAPFKAEQVIVQVGSLTDVSPRLKVGSTAETVDVTAEAPQINTTSPDFAPTINNTQIENLPINGGRWSSFSLLTPGAVSNSSGFGLISFRGISTLLNNNTVDGADNNQAFFSEERGRTRIGYSTPQAAIDEFQVNTSNFTTEYGRAAGAVINTVTKSGTNTIHGEAYGFDRDNTFGATNPFTVITTQPTPGNFLVSPYKPTDKRWIAGFALGGPAIKDKLFWHVTFDYYHRNFPGTGVPSNSQAFFATPTCYTASPTTPFNGTQCDPTTTLATFATRMSGSNTPANDQAGLNLWNSDLAGLNTMLGPVPRTGESFILLPKIDWNISQKNHASFELNRMRWASPAGIQTQSTNTNGIASFGNDFVKDTWGVAKLNTFFTANLSNEVRFQYGRDFEYEFTQQPTPYELANLVNTPTFTNPLGLPPQVSITNGFTFGVPSFLQRPAFPDESTIQVADTISWIHGNHSVKFGTDVRHVDDLSQNLRNQFGSYSYSSLLAYFSDLNKAGACGGVGCYNSNGFSQAFGPLGFEFTSNDYGFFVEDNWKALKRLTLSLGVRYDYEQLPHVFANLVNPDIPQTGQLPRDQNNFGPRAGFAWDIFGNSKTVLRGGYGIFYGRIINSTIFNALTQTGIIAGAQSSFSFSPSSAGAPIFPQVFAGPPTASGAKPNAIFFDKHFQTPQIQEMDMSLEHDLGWGTVAKVSYLGSMGRELPDFVDTNFCANASQVGCSGGAGFGTLPTTVTFTVAPGGPLGISSLSRTVYTSRPKVPAALLSTCPACKYNALTDIFSGANSSYNALVFQLEHRMSHHIQFGINWTWSHAIDFGQNETTFSDTNDLLDPFNIAAERSNSIYDVRQRLVANAIMESPWKHQGWLSYLVDNWQLSPIFQAQKGLPFTLTATGSAPGGAAGGIAGTNGFPNWIVGRNTFRFPNTYIGDIRLAKYIKFQERYSLELTSDFFNIANHVNVTGVANTGYAISGTNLNLTSAPVLPFNTITNGNSNFIYSPRQIQLGARFKF